MLRKLSFLKQRALLFFTRNKMTPSSIQSSSGSSGSSSTASLPWVHSTFRDSQGDTLYPNGLEWRMPGKSHVVFVVPDNQSSNLDSETFRQNIVQAYNRWCFAKDRKFYTVEDIISIQNEGDFHVKVEWKENENFEKIIKHENIEKLLRDDPAASNITGKDAAEVWVNGVLVGSLNGPENIEHLIASIPETANKLSYKRSEGRIRIDRYFIGGLRRPQVWEHIWDCLIALEDPKILDDNTMIGTATLPDWIMGGKLTSRLWVRDMGDSIRFLRPLYNDNIDTSDRRYELKQDKEPVRLKMARTEISRLRYLATIPHPYKYDVAKEGVITEDPYADVKEKLRRNRKSGKFFGI